MLAGFEVVKIDLELGLVMLEKKNLMITPRVLHLNFEFKAEIRAGKKANVCKYRSGVYAFDILKGFGNAIRFFLRVSRGNQKDRGTFDGI